MSKEKKVKDPQTTTKRALRLLLINGVLWVWCSYILAFLDKTVIADLPEKMVLDDYCYLTKSQAALYEKTLNTLKKLEKS